MNYKDDFYAIDKLNPSNEASELMHYKIVDIDNLNGVIYLEDNERRLFFITRPPHNRQFGKFLDQKNK